MIRKSFGSKVKDTYTWHLEEEVVPKLKGINWNSFKRKINIYLALSLILIPFSFYMSYFEFNEGLRASTNLSLSIGLLVAFFILLFWWGQNSRFFLPKNMGLTVFENGSTTLTIDKNTVEIDELKRIDETENHIIVMIKVIGVQTPVPIPKSIFKKVLVR